MALQVYGYPSIVQGSMIQGSIAQQNEFFRQINSTGEMSSVKGNRLYERADGSIGLAEKSIGYVIGEQLAPIIESVSFTIKSFFGYLKERVKKDDESCLDRVAFGLTASIVVQHPWPAILETTACFFPPVNAQKMQSTRSRILQDMNRVRGDAGVKTIETVDAERYKSAPTGADPILSQLEATKLSQLKATKVKMLSEFVGILPSNIQKMLESSSGYNWIEIILDGIKNVFLDFTQINAPTGQLEEVLKEAEIKYWMTIVYDKYSEIFPEPQCAWNGQGAIDYSYEINIMRETLISYGYSLGQGTPLEFLNSLKESGVCQGGSCRWEH